MKNGRRAAAAGHKTTQRRRRPPVRRRTALPPTPSDKPRRHWHGRLGSYSVQCTRFNAPQNVKSPQLVTCVWCSAWKTTRQLSPFVPFFSAALMSTNAVTVRSLPKRQRKFTNYRWADVSYDCRLLQWVTETTNANGNIQVKVCMRIAGPR